MFAEVGLVFDMSMSQHDTGKGHPESAERLNHIKKGLNTSKLIEKLYPIQTSLAGDDWILSVHTPEYLEIVKQSVAKKLKTLPTGDVQLSNESLTVARKAVGGVLNACDAVMNKKVKRAFCALRPPGHHAEPNKGMGFCIFNNVAIAARYLQKKHNLKRILIIDWDVHHGNGTHAAFREDPTVFDFHVHQDPRTIYPGTGFAHEKGVGKGKGFSKHVPLPPGSGDVEVLKVLNNDLAEVREKFKPEFILISAGFDMYKSDPLGGLKVSQEGFVAMTKAVKVMADKYCEGKLISVLEGGYSVKALTEVVPAHVEALF